MLAKRLIDGLYVEAMVLADEVRAYFDDSARPGREAFDPMDRVLFSCESLKVTTRLMHIIAWLLTQRAVEIGELAPEHAREPSRRLGNAVESEASVVARLPGEAQDLVHASLELYRRVARLEAGFDEVTVSSSPARHLLHRLQQAF